MSALGKFLERRSVENPAQPLTSTALAEWLDGPGRTDSGMTVNENTAMSLIAVFRCVELIAGTCASLPIKAYRQGTRVSVDSPVLFDPHPELTRFEVWEQAYACLLLWGNAYMRKLRDGAGRIRYLWPIHPSRVRVDLVSPTAEAPGGKVFQIRDNEGQWRPFSSYEILHLPGLGYDGRVGLSRIQLAKQGIGLGLAAEQYAAKFFGSGQLLSGILSTDQVIDQAKADEVKARWKAKYGGIASAHDVAVLGAGVKFQPVSIPPEDAQLLQTQSYSVSQIARLFGIPPHAIGDVEKSTSWGSGIEQQTIGMVQFTLQPSYLTRVEQRLTKEVVQPTNPNVYAEYVVEGLLRGDSAARAAFYSQMRQMKAMTANEVRARENLEPYEGGDVFENPNIDTTDEADTQQTDRQRAGRLFDLRALWAPDTKEGALNGHDEDASRLG